jgi:hypothetical protein
MEVYFNIGLNVKGAESPDMLNRVLRILTIHGEVRAIALQAGEWQGAPERSVQAKLDCYGDPVATAAALASYLEQDGIALHLPVPSPEWSGNWVVWNARGIAVGDGTLADFPIIVD